MQEDEDQNKKTSKYYSDNLLNKINHFKDNYGLEAPNVPDKIEFEDFMLYTRAIKYFSNILNDICFPEIETFVIVAKNDQTLQLKLRQCQKIIHNGDLLRRINHLRSYFNNHFNTAYKEFNDEFCKLYLSTENIDCSEYL